MIERMSHPDRPDRPERKAGRQRAMLIGALGGAGMAVCCVVIPQVANPRWHLAPGLTVFLVLGLGALGGLFGLMNHEAGR